MLCSYILAMVYSWFLMYLIYTFIVISSQSWYLILRTIVFLAIKFDKVFVCVRLSPIHCYCSLPIVAFIYYSLAYQN